MKKFFAVFLALVLVVAGSGCSGAGGASSGQSAAPQSKAGAPAGGKKSISMASQKWNESGTGDFLRLKAKEFVEQNPEYEFEEIYYETGELVTQMLLAIAAGTPPDIIEWTYSKVAPVINAGDVAQINDLVSDDLIARFQAGDFGDALKTAPLYTDGKYNGVLYQQSNLQLMCNTLMFQEAGLKLPTTYQEFFDACIALTDAPNKYGYAFCTQETATRIYEQFCFWAYGFDENYLADGEINVNTPKIIEAMTEWKKLLDANVTPVGTAKNAYRSMFGQGSIGMIIDGPWVYASALSEQNNVAEHIQVVPTCFPTGISTGDGSALIIPKDAKNKEGAGEFLDYILSHENQKLWCEMTSSICGDNTATTDFVKKNKWFSGYADASAKGLVKSLYPVNHPDSYEEIEKIVVNYLQQIWFSNVPPAEAMASCQAELDKLLK